MFIFASFSLSDFYEFSYRMPAFSEKEKIMMEHNEAGKKNDYSLLMELQEKADGKDEEILLVMEEWENMEAELADLKSKV